MKYSKNFDRDFQWYLKVRNYFDFDGSAPKDIAYDRNGIDGKKAFLMYDSQGKLVPTKHPSLLAKLIKVKGGVNLHIKMYAEDRANGCLPKVLFDEICEEVKAPLWFAEAVENQKGRYYK